MTPQRGAQEALGPQNGASTVAPRPPFRFVLTPQPARCASRLSLVGLLAAVLMGQSPGMDALDGHDAVQEPFQHVAVERAYRYTGALPLAADHDDRAFFKTLQSQHRLVAVIVRFHHADASTLSSGPAFGLRRDRPLMEGAIDSKNRLIDDIVQRDDWYLSKRARPDDPRVAALADERHVLYLEMEPAATSIRLAYADGELESRVQADGPVILPLKRASFALISLHRFGEVKPHVVRWGLLLRLDNNRADSFMMDFELTLASGCFADRHTRITVSKALHVLEAPSGREPVPERYVMDFFDVSEGQEPLKLNFWPVPGTAPPLPAAKRQALLAAADAVHGNAGPTTPTFGPAWYANDASGVGCVAPSLR